MLMVISGNASLNLRSVTMHSGYSFTTKNVPLISIGCNDIENISTGDCIGVALSRIESSAN
jgi:hypothetical protein